MEGIKTNKQTEVWEDSEGIKTEQTDRGVGGLGSHKDRQTERGGLGRHKDRQTDRLWEGFGSHKDRETDRGVGGFGRHKDIQTERCVEDLEGIKDRQKQNTDLHNHTPKEIPTCLSVPPWKPEALPNINMEIPGIEDKRLQTPEERRGITDAFLNIHYTCDSWDTSLYEWLC